VGPVLHPEHRVGLRSSAAARLGLRRDSGSTRASSRSTSGSYDSCSRRWRWASSGNLWLGFRLTRPGQSSRNPGKCFRPDVAV